MAILGLWKKIGGTAEPLGDLADTAYYNNLSEADFVRLYLEQLLSSVAEKVAGAFAGEDRIFQFGANSDRQSNLLSSTVNLKEIALAILTCERVFVSKWRETSTGSEIYLLNEGRTETGTRQWGATTLEFLEGWSFKGYFENIELLYLPLKLVYLNYRNLLTTGSVSGGVFLGKKGLNAILQGSNIESYDTAIEDARKQFNAMIDAKKGIIDADDEIMSFQVAVTNLADSVDFARTELSMLLDIPKNELTGEQYTSTLGTKGSEQVDERKFRRKLTFFREQYLIPMLKSFSIPFSYQRYTAQEKFELTQLYSSSLQYIVDADIESALKTELMAVLNDKQKAI